VPGLSEIRVGGVIADIAPVDFEGRYPVVERRDRRHAGIGEAEREAAYTAIKIYEIHLCSPLSKRS
jgi:hypothetical protein